jgi:hypothetical protein
MDWFGLVSDVDAGVILEQMVQSLDCRVKELPESRNSGGNLV